MAVRFQVPRTTSYEDAVWMFADMQSDPEDLDQQRRDPNFTQGKLNLLRSFIERTGLVYPGDLNKFSVIQIAGKNGKGSTSAFCESILRRHGYKTGVLASKHSDEARERIRIDGQPLSKEKFTEYFWKVYTRLTNTMSSPKLSEIGGMPAYFAFTVLMSIHVFIEEKVEVAIYNVFAVGGQHDYTSIFPQPVVCGITCLALDSTRDPGALTRLAAGNFKEKVPVVTVEQVTSSQQNDGQDDTEHPLQILLEKAKEKNAPLYVVRGLSRDTPLGIPGPAQCQNAGLAVQLCKIILSRGINGLPANVLPESYKDMEVLVLGDSDVDENTRRGLAESTRVGCCQVVKRGDITYYLDSAASLESLQMAYQWFVQESDEEIKSKSMKRNQVSRVFLFNLYERGVDVTHYLQKLLQYDCDAAVFCPSVTSTIRSGTKPDHYSKLLTKKAIRAELDLLKHEWTKLSTIPCYTFESILEALTGQFRTEIRWSKSGTRQP